jgi:hypothetical protein
VKKEEEPITQLQQNDPFIYDDPFTTVKKEEEPVTHFWSFKKNKKDKKQHVKL